jgi:hypothetical protein
MTLSKSFLDVTYSCLMLLRGTDSQINEAPLHFNENQSGQQFKRFGQKRMRAIELLRQIISTLSSNGDVSLSSFISKILKT